ncbi:MAG TPA: hypothetical protein VFX49_01860 [Chloroflexota bacterium]|nr:hypothetical protein [Chloroflexota bacterium]
MTRARRISLLAGSVAGALLISACAVGVRSDRAAIGGGPEQATAQARIVFQTTVVALATTNAGTLSSAQPCDCESTGK